MKGSRTDLTASPCGIARSLQVLGDWWTLLIVRDIFSGKNHFSEIQKNLGCAKNILSARLKKLINDGVVEVEECEGLSRHRYVLTEKGLRLHVVLVALWQWGVENCFDGTTITRALADRTTGKVIKKLEVVTVDGAPFAPNGFDLVPKPKKAKKVLSRNNKR